MIARGWWSGVVTDVTVRGDRVARAGSFVARRRVVYGNASAGRDQNGQINGASDTVMQPSSKFRGTPIRR
jgi:hypothetical protein